MVKSQPKEQAENSKTGGSGSEIAHKYTKLKKRYKQLRDEYTKVLGSWENGARSIKALLDERRFLKNKLMTIFKSQNFIDEEIFGNNTKDPKKETHDLTTSSSQKKLPNGQAPPKKEDGVQILSSNPQQQKMAPNGTLQPHNPNSYGQQNH